MQAALNKSLLKQLGLLEVYQSWVAASGLNMDTVFTVKQQNMDITRVAVSNSSVQYSITTRFLTFLPEEEFKLSNYI